MDDYDHTVGGIIETIIEEHYKEDATGKDFFQFLLTNSAYLNLSYMFGAVTNFLPVKHTKDQTQLTVACLAPTALTELLQTIVLSKACARWCEIRQRRQFARKNSVT